VEDPFLGEAVAASLVAASVAVYDKQKQAMRNIKIIGGSFNSKLELEHASIAAGFPSPADDYRHETLDFNRDYIRHPEATFYGDVEGDSMKDAYLFDGDRVIIDRAIEPHHGSIVVAWWNGGFTMKFLDLTHRKDGYIELRPANDKYPVFKVDNPDEFEIWGVVVHQIRTFEKL
jgi:DNA polymerase V